MGALALLFASLTAALAANAWSEYGIRRDWPQTSSVIEGLPTQGACPNGRSGAEVRYHYSVAGRAYSNQYAVACTSKQAKRLKAPRFAPGALNPVFYNPHNPGQSLLDTGAGDKWFSYGAPLAVGMLTLGLGYMLVLAIRARLRMRRYLFLPNGRR